MSRGFRRAREAYLLGNTITGIALLAFVFGVYTYSIKAVKQVTFDDVDEEALAQQMNSKKSNVAPAAPATTPAPTPLTLEQERPLKAAPLGSTAIVTSPTPRGLIPRLLGERYPSLLDPVSKTLVWGAPPLDRLGRWGDVRK